jgi:hypothetical protein
MELDGVVQTILVPLAASAVGAAFCGGMLYLRRLGRELRTKGVTARATVHRKFRGDQDSLENFYAVFSFEDRQHTPRLVEVKVPSRVWRGLREGETTAITYLADHPETAGIGPAWGRKLVGGALLYLALVGAALAIFGVALPLWDFLGQTDNVEAAPEFLILGAFIAGFPVLFLLSRRQSARRNAAMAAFAAGRGWDFLGDDGTQLLSLLKAFGPQEVWRVYHVVRGEIPGGRLYLFRCGSRVRASRSSGSDGFGCLAEGGRFTNEEVVTVYPRLPVVHRLMADKVDVGGADFRRKYVALCERRDPAEAAVSPRVQEILLEHAAAPGWVVEVRIASAGVLVLTSHAVGPPEWAHLVDLAERILSG